MSNLVKREQLEELLLSLILGVYTKEDINEINSIYNLYKNKQYVFPLSKTELYFKQFIITYCKNKKQEIKDKLKKEPFPESNSILEEFEKNFVEEEQNIKYLTFDIIDNTNNNNNNNNSNIHNDELRESLLEHNQTPFCSKYRTLFIKLIAVVAVLILIIIFK